MSRAWLTEREYEAHVCCVRPHLCREEHFHQSDVEALIASRVKAALAPVEALADQLLAELLAAGREPTTFERNVHTELRAVLTTPTETRTP